MGKVNLRSFEVLMKYILNPNIALRSWRLVPYAYYIRHSRDAVGLSREQFEILSRCDGEQELQESELLRILVGSGMARPVTGGEKMTEWQKPKFCDNRYFPSMSWMITGKCNYNCLHCFNAADNAPLMSEFTSEEAEKLIEEAEICGINAVTITGGEPMLHKNFFDIIERIYKHGMYVRELNTNGFFIDDGALTRLKAIDDGIKIKISFDGIGHHDWLRNRKGAEENALRAIRLCREHGFFTQVQTNVHRKNLDTLLQTAETMDSMGVEHMRIIRTTEAPRWIKNADGATLGIGEYYDTMFDFLRSYIKEKHKMSIDIWQVAQVYPDIRSYRARPVECSKGEYRDSIPVCRGNRGMVSVDANGDVVPCHQLSGYYASHGLHIGNVKKDGLKPILQSGSYIDEVCATLGKLKTHNETCASCKYFRYCAGGCRAIALAFTNDKFGVDPSKCIFFKNGYYEKLTGTMGDWRNLSPISLN